MSPYLERSYRESLALHTDLYQLTMAAGYWKLGRHTTETVFQHFFRRHPFGGGFTVAAGLEPLVEFIENFHFEQSDLDYLAGLTGNNGEALFPEGFLAYLADLRLDCDVDAVPEGTVVFPQGILVRVSGPIVPCQLIETPLLNLVNFPTLIATKAARICLAAQGDGVLEFGLRRAQGIDGALTAARAACIGGCVGTSNVLAGKMFGVPVKGTHAHSWVMLYENELDAFEAYAEAMPNNALFLVDTYDSIQGVKNAIRAGEKLRAKGYEMAGIRLDSGDLAYLSQQARRLLDEAGFDKAAIVASNDLDEHTIASLKAQGAAIDLWGVGTRLATGHEDASLGGVYKLAAVREPGESAWRPRIKISEHTAKTTNPGILQVRRYTDGDLFAGDMIHPANEPPRTPCEIVDPTDEMRRKHICADMDFEDLLEPVMRGGKRVRDLPGVETIRERVAAQLARLHPGIKRFANPHEYPVGLSPELYERKRAMVEDIKGETQDS